MGFLDTLLGRSKPVKPDLDQLFGLPAAAVTLEAATQFRPTGVGSVCFKPAEGGAFGSLREQVDALMAVDADRYAEQTDEYGYRWLVRTTTPDQLEDLVADLHTVNSTLADAGFGSLLLCTVVAFSDGSRPLGLVYLYKRGAWYPFAPTGGQKRDNALELQMRAVVADDLRVEDDLSRWFPLWGAPGLS